MITSVQVSRFRGIREGELDGLGPLTILVGPNGSGKSSILDALFIAASEQREPAIRRVVERRLESQNGQQWLLYRGGRDGNLSLQIAGTTPDGRSFANHAAYEWSLRKGEMALNGMLLVSDPLTKQSFPAVKLIETRPSNAQSPLHRVFSAAVKEGRRSEAIAAIKSILPELTNIEILTEGDSPTVHLVFEGHAVQVALAGDGVAALVRLSLELAALADGLALMEEPEVHQHPAAIRQSAPAIWTAVRRGLQVVLTTHSLELIDALVDGAQPDELDKLVLFRLNLDRGRLTGRRVPGPDIVFARAQIGDDLR